MPERKSAYIDVQALLPKVSLEQAAGYYGVTLPELQRIGDEVRSRCFLNCGRTEETGNRALAIQMESATKVWKCFQYGCARGGNLVGLCDLIKPGENAGGRPRGERFKEIARDLQRMVAGESPSESAEPVAPPLNKTPVLRVNRPLADAENERARELVELDEQFVVDPAQMPPEAAGYFRKRPFLTPETCRQYRLGYLPRSGKSLLRGKIVYPYFNAAGELLTWFGRDPLYEEKLRRWQAAGRAEPEPVKTQFVKGFQRGLELWGEHIVRAGEGLSVHPRVGLVIVEGPNDALNLHALGVPAIALCSHTVTKEQIERIAHLARDMSDERVTLMLDCDAAGESGVAQVLPLLVEHVHVRVPWRGSSQAGRFRDRQPESLSSAELAELFARAEQP